MKVFLTIWLTVFCLVCLAQQAPPVPASSQAAVSVSAPAPISVSSVFSSLAANWALILLIVKSVLDLLFAINPKADAPGGVIDSIYLFCKSKLSPQPGVKS